MKTTIVGWVLIACAVLQLVVALAGGEHRLITIGVAVLMGLAGLFTLTRGHRRS